MHNGDSERVIQCDYCSNYLEDFLLRMEDGDTAESAAQNMIWPNPPNHARFTMESGAPSPTPPQMTASDMFRALSTSSAPLRWNTSATLRGAPRPPSGQEMIDRRQRALELIPQWVYDGLCAWHAYPGTDRSIINCSECGERLDRRWDNNFNPITEQAFFLPVLRPMHAIPRDYWTNYRTRANNENLLLAEERARADRAVRSGSQFKTVNNP